jgi:hypothetical protein
VDAAVGDLRRVFRVLFSRDPIDHEKLQKFQSVNKMIKNKMGGFQMKCCSE